MAIRKPPEETPGERLNKYIAHCGIASRRKAAEIIASGQVKVNGQVVIESGYKVQPDDVVSYQGKDVKPEVQKVYLLINKPKDYITTTSDERGRRTIMDLLKRDVRQRVYPVGRLDRMTTGLLLLTNDGDLAKKLSHPSYEIKKIYQVTLNRSMTPTDLNKLRSGVDLEDGKAVPDAVDFVRGSTSGKDLGIELHSGKNRIIRRMFEHFGYEVVKLDRVYYAGLTKKDLPRGRYRHLTGQEVIMLKHFI